MSWIGIDEVKVELNKSSSSAVDDAALTAKMEAACAEIERRVGRVDPVAVVETVTVGYDGITMLAETPVIAVDDVQLLTGTGTVAVDIGSGDADSSGVLYGLPAGSVTIAYRAGRDPIPGDFVEAAVQLTAHLWRASRSLTEGGRARSETPMGPGMSSAMPNKVKDLLGLTGKSSRSRVFVG